MHKNCSLFPNKMLSSNPVKIHIPYKILYQGQTKIYKDKIYKDIAMR